MERWKVLRLATLAQDDRDLREVGIHAAGMRAVSKPSRGVIASWKVWLRLFACGYLADSIRGLSFRLRSYLTPLRMTEIRNNVGRR